jgi:hypothetical protein
MPTCRDASSTTVGSMRCAPEALSVRRDRLVVLGDQIGPSARPWPGRPGPGRRQSGQTTVAPALGPNVAIHLGARDCRRCPWRVDGEPLSTLPRRSRSSPARAARRSLRRSRMCAMTSVPRKRKVIGSACASMENGSVEGGATAPKTKVPKMIKVPGRRIPEYAPAGLAE